MEQNQLTTEQIARIHDLYPESVRLEYTGTDNEDLQYHGMKTMNWRRLRDSRAANTDWKLLLKPISSISDEDAIEVAKIFGYKVKPRGKDSSDLKDRESVRYTGQLIVQGFANNSTVETADMMWEAFEYLISKGYALPLRALGGKTAIEIGLAIDSTQSAQS